MNRRADILSQLSDLPTFPPAALKLMQLLRHPDTTIPEITKIIELEPALTSRVLRMANSAFYGLPVRVGTVRDAIIRLGFAKITEIVIASSVNPMLSVEIPGYDLEHNDLWRHSVAVAIAAKQIASMQHPQIAEYAFTAGLLHDIGRLIMSSYVAPVRDQLYSIAEREELSYDEVENKEFDISAAEAGGEVLAHWQLPDEIVTAVRYHLTPDLAPGDQTLTEVIHLANGLILMTGIGVGTDGLRFRMNTTVVEKFGLNPVAVAKLMNEVHTQLVAADELIMAD
ncbi:MAG: HDOD domain-containing protein [bacterium]|nr:HDOD domain-containing protein [bacterium]